MASRPPRICTCGRKVAAGQPCQCQRDRVRARPTASARGYGSKWQREAKAWLAQPGNDRCAAPGCIRPADTVAHKVAHKGDQRLFWDRKNWSPSCRQHNAAQCAKIEGGFGNPVGGGSRISREAGGRPGFTSTRDTPEIELSQENA